MTQCLTIYFACLFLSVEDLAMFLLGPSLIMASLTQLSLTSTFVHTKEDRLVFNAK